MAGPPSRSASSKGAKEGGDAAVTFVLLTYNQERFAVEAMRAALAQDYPNLEVIVSDDCSTDSTLSLLKAEAAQYEGPHRVVVRRTGRNLGLVSHLYDAVQAASGELIVAAAGDDLSYPQRVSRLVEAWRESGADALHSSWDVIDEDGNVVRRSRPEGSSDLRLDAFFPGREVQRITGATGAYARPMFEIAPCPAPPIFAEDLYFSLFLNGFGRTIAYVDEALIAYRQNSAALTHTGPHRSVADHERSIEAESAHIAGVLDAFRREAAGGSAWGEPDVDWRALDEDIAFNLFRSCWITAGPWRRLRALTRFTAPSQRRWLLPRVLGLSPLVAVKRLTGRR